MTAGYFSRESCDIDQFEALIARTTDATQLRFTQNVSNNIPIYDATTVPLSGPDRSALMEEWASVLLTGPGVLAIQNVYPDTRPLDAATVLYEQMIQAERSQNQPSADHFAAGTNDRVWNSLQKLCLADPATFADVFSRPAIDTVAEAWLGPNYQMSAQVNLVHPGGVAQEAHRDYHLGFQTEEQASKYPVHVHSLSPAMTLQGAIAHVDMPVESGTTKLLPYSQIYGPGYLAYRLPAFRDCFEANYVQLPLAKGDALFFNPALFHAGGDNRTSDVERFANLLQIGSAMGRVLENINRSAMCKALFPVLQQMQLPQDERDAAIAACAEGYPFPTNLDTDPPVGGLAPESQADLFRRALSEGMNPPDFNAALDAQAQKQRA